MAHIDERGDVDPDFAQLIGGLAEALGPKITAFRIKLYAKALEDLTIVQVRQACGRLLRDAQFFPQPAEIRRQVEASPDDAALLAWAGLIQAASAVGSWGSLEVEDGAAADALVLVFGSWPEFCDLTEAAMGARRQEFLAAYRQGRRRVPAARRLQGLCESTGTYPTGSERRAVWAGRLTAGGAVEATRERPALPAGETDGRKAIAAPETGTQEAGQGQEEAAGKAGQGRRPPKGRRT